MFAVMFAVRKFRSYLLPKAFIILTLEHNLPYAIQHMSISPRISKWVLELQEYDYSFIVEDSTRASLADVLTYRVHEKKVTKAKEEKIYLPKEDLEEAHTLYFDGAYRRQLGKAAGGIIILSPSKEVIMKKGTTLKDAHSNNEAEYFTLIFGLNECIKLGIQRLSIKGDALLVVRQIQGIWACKNSKLFEMIKQAKSLMKKFEVVQIQHVARIHNKEADLLANEQLEVHIGAIKFQEPKLQGQEMLEDILFFLHSGECPKNMERVQRHRLVKKSLSYQLIGDDLYHKGKDLILRRVPYVREIDKILESCHDGVCGGHFAQEITSRKFCKQDLFGQVCIGMYNIGAKLAGLAKKQVIKSSLMVQGFQ